jgi:hypothetical protein
MVGVYRLVDKVDPPDNLSAIHTVTFGHVGGNALKIPAVTFPQMGNHFVGKDLAAGTRDNGKICRVCMVHGWENDATLKANFQEW